MTNINGPPGTFMLSKVVHPKHKWSRWTYNKIYITASITALLNYSYLATLLDASRGVTEHLNKHLNEQRQWKQKLGIA